MGVAFLCDEVVDEPFLSLQHCNTSYSLMFSCNVEEAKQCIRQCFTRCKFISPQNKQTNKQNKQTNKKNKQKTDQNMGTRSLLFTTWSKAFIAHVTTLHKARIPFKIGKWNLLSCFNSLTRNADSGLFSLKTCTHKHTPHHTHTRTHTHIIHTHTNPHDTASLCYDLPLTYDCIFFVRHSCMVWLISDKNMYAEK